MLKFLSIRLLLMAAVVFLMTWSPTRAQWQAGTARAVITPITDVWLAGYGSKRPPDGKLHDLWLKVLVLKDQRGTVLVWLTSDFQGVPKSMSDVVFQQLQTSYGMTRSQVMFTFSHNHCGPRLGDDLIDYYPVEEQQEQLVAEYTQQMIELTVKTVGEALDSLQAVELAWGIGQTTFAVNRRNNREADVPQILQTGRELLGPVDHSVPVLQVTRSDGSPLAIVFGYACHPTTLSFNTWCGDYPGFAQIEIEAEYPGTQAMFVNTCGGDQNPLPRRTVELCRKYGHMLADAVQAVLKQPLEPIAGQLSHRFELVPLSYLEVADRGLLETAASDNNPIRARWAQRMLRSLDQGARFDSQYPYPIHAWRVGQQMLVIGMGAETVVDYALKFKQIYGPGTWVCGYSDDMISYIPSRRVWEEGGYEGGSNLYEYGRPALRWAGDIEERITTAVQRVVSQLTPPPLAN